MMKEQLYTYKLRPGYGSPHYMIEFDIYPDMDLFMKELLEILLKNGYQYARKVDLWMNDEEMIILNSRNGQISLTKDIWNMVFIMGNDNQKDIFSIHDLLKEDGRFKNEPYDVEDYRLE